MLHTVDQNDLLVFEDLVDDAVATAAGGPKCFEFTDERLAEPGRVLSDRPEDGPQCGVSLEPQRVAGLPTWRLGAGADMHGNRRHERD
jgi:hypothetical protein